MTKTSKKLKKCPACNQIFKSTLVVCPRDRTMLLTPESFIQSQRPYDVLKRWVLGPYESVSWRCRKCGEEETKNIFGRCKNDWSRIVPKTDIHTPDEPPLLLDRFKFVSFSETKKLTEVYEAFDSVTDKPVFVEILHPNLGWDRKTVERFYNGSLDGMKLEHPGIPKIIAVDYLEKDRTVGIPDIVYFITEPVKGKSLASIVKEEGRLAPPLVVSIFSQVLEAIEYAHSKSVFHANLTLNSVYIDRKDKSPEVSVLGFGIAERLFRDLEWDGPESATKTISIYGEIFGLAPELISGKRPNQFSDIYSVGCALYECLSGNPPFDESSPVLTLIAHLKNEPGVFDSTIEIPGKLEKNVLKCLSKTPEDRFGSAKHLNDELKNSLN